MSSSTIFTIIEAIWNGNGEYWDIAGFINALFSYQPSTTQIYLQMLPKTWLEKNLWYADPVTLKQLIRKLDYVYKRIVDNKQMTMANLWVIDNYFNLIEGDNPALIGKHQYHSYFEKQRLLNQAKLFEVFSTLNMMNSINNTEFMSEVWIANFVRELAKSRKAKDFNKTLQIINEIVPNEYEMYDGVNNVGGGITTLVIENIKITDSSWLSTIEYHPREHIAIFTLKTSTKKYTFYQVPRVAVSFVEVNRGQEMWNGFGLKYSINPTHWIRQGSFLYYEKRQHLDNLKAGYIRPSAYRNTYKRKRKGNPS